MVKKKLFKKGDNIKLDLGAGQSKATGFIGVDRMEGSDVVADLTKPFDWAEDESVSEIFSSHFIEHLTGEEFILFMDECYRVLVPEGKMTFIAPYYTSARCFQDPTHKQSICEAKFIYFNKAARDNMKLQHYGIKSDFDFTYGYSINAEWQNRSAEALAFAIKSYWNVIDDIHITLTKR